jgi:bacteriocin-like protein
MRHKTTRQRRGDRKPTLKKETIRELTVTLTDEELAQVAGGTALTYWPRYTCQCTA